MKRLTPVPAWGTVRMKRASNMMAKWYQNAMTAWPPRVWKKCCAMPRAMRRRAAGAVEQGLLADRVRQRRHLAGVLREPPCADGVRRGSGSLPHDAGGAVDGEVDAGLQDTGRDHGHDGDHGLGHHATVAERSGFRFRAGSVWAWCRWKSGNETRLMAPQAMVIKAKGKILPANAGPVPSAERVRGGMCRGAGRNATMPTAGMRDGAEFHKRAQVIAGRQQQPHGQGGSGEPVNDDAGFPAWVP